MNEVSMSGHKIIEKPYLKKRKKGTPDSVRRKPLNGLPRRKLINELLKEKLIKNHQNQNQLPEIHLNGSHRQYRQLRFPWVL